MYKLKFKPLDLYYTPDKGNGNLSHIGKIYRLKPNPKQYKVISFSICSWLGKQNKHQRAISDYFGIKLNDNLSNLHVRAVNESDWEVIEIKTVDSIKKLFLIEFTSGDQWEMCRGFCAIYSETEDNAKEIFNIKCGREIISVKDISFNGTDYIEICQPLKYIKHDLL